MHVDWQPYAYTCVWWTGIIYLSAWSLQVAVLEEAGKKTVDTLLAKMTTDSSRMDIASLQSRLQAREVCTNMEVCVRYVDLVSVFLH